MPSKFSYSNLSETHDRLKREAQQYLDSLDVSASDIYTTVAEDAAPDSTSKFTDATGHDHSGATQTSDSEETDDVPEMAFQRTGTFGDDDSLVAMAQRLDDASVISYSSFDVHSQYTNEEDDDKPSLALPCSTGNTGIRAKKIFPKEKRCGPEVKAKKSGTKSAEVAKERRKHRQKLKQVYDDIADITKQFDSTEKTKKASFPQPKDRKSRSVSRERKSDTKDLDAKWKSNSFYESKPMPSRRKSMEDTRIENKTTEGRKFYTVEKKSTPKVSERKDEDKPAITRRNQKAGPWNDSECTVQTDNKQDKTKRHRGKKSKGKARRGRGSQCESDDESMRGVGCNVRIHDKKDRVDGDRKSKKKGESRTRSSSKTKAKNKESAAAPRPRSSSTPPALKSKKPNAEQAVDASVESDAEAQSVYDSDCNTEFFYESTDDDEWSSDEEDLPMVGTSVQKAVEDLNNKSIGFKMKSMLGIRG